METIDITNFNISSVKRTGHMFEKCTYLTSLNLTNFAFNSIDNMDYMFSESKDLVYINFENLVDDNIKSMYNIFLGTPENMVICINESNKKMMDIIKNTKKCSVVDCSKNWTESRRKVKAKDNLCVEDCNVGYKYLYDFKCYERCPKDTYSEDYICKKNITNEKGCSIKSFFLGNCTLDNLSITENKWKFIELTSKEILNLTLYELLLDAVLDKKIFTRNLTNEIYQIYSLSNKKRIDEIAYINFDDCAKILREKHKLEENEDLIIFKIEYIYPYIKIPIIEYQIFNKNGMRKLNLNHCKNVKVLYYIPKKINNYEEYKYNPQHPYYTEKCVIIDNNFSSDLVLFDRKNEFNKNNMSLCESMCTFKGYVNNHIICECEIKLKFNSFFSVKSDKYSLIYRFDINAINENNFWTINCFLNGKAKFLLMFNLYSIFNIIIFILIISGAVLFKKKEYNLINKKIRMFIQICIRIKNEKREINESEKEKSYLEEEEEEINENSKDINKNEKQLKINYENIKATEKSKNEISNDLNFKNKSTSKDFLSIKSNKIFKTNKRYLIHSNKKQMRKDIANKHINYNSQDTSNIDSKDQLEKKVNLNISKNNNKINLNKSQKEKLLTKTDYDLNNLSYNDAKIFDKRTFCKYYLSLIKKKHIIFIVFKQKFKFNSKIIHYCFFIFLFPLYLTINTFFVNSYTIHNIYISQGSFDLLYNITNIIIATFILYLIQTILCHFISIDDDILEIKNITGRNKSEIINQKFRIITNKYILFFSISLISLNFCGFYIGCFSAIFPKTKLHLFIRLIISLSFSLIIPFLLYFFPACFRIYALKKKGKEDLYRISQRLQFI